MGKHFFFLFLASLLAICSGFRSSASIPSGSENVGSTISYFEDQAGGYKIEDLKKGPFSLLETNQPNFGLTTSVYWFKIEVTNGTPDSVFWFSVQNPSITNVHFYNDIKDTAGVQYIGISTPKKD